MKKFILFVVFLIGFMLVQTAAFSQDYDIYTVAYMNRLQNKVKSNWVISHGEPDVKTVVAFKITKDGKITNAVITNKSGDDEFDQNALSAIYKSAPFENIPQSINGDNLSINFVFNQNGIEATPIFETAITSEISKNAYVYDSSPIVDIQPIEVKSDTQVKNVSYKTGKVSKHKHKSSHTHSHRVTAKTAAAGVLSLAVWPGLGQLVNDGPSEKAGIHAILGFITIFRFWSFYDALVHRQEGPV